MSFMCPVCNGLQPLTAACPSCQHDAEDCGRFNDYLGPYSPYREIDDISISNGYPDLAHQACVHLMSCSTCRTSFTICVSSSDLK